MTLKATEAGQELVNEFRQDRAINNNTSNFDVVLAMLDDEQYEESKIDLIVFAVSQYAAAANDEILTKFCSRL